MSEPKITTQAAHVSAGSNLPINRVVVHATCPMLGSPKASAAGQAAGTARYFTDQASGGSAHYVEDVDAEEHCVKDAAIAWHAPPNPHSVGVEICADGGSEAAYKVKPWANYTREDWLSGDVWPAVRRAALRVRELCDRFDVPKVRLSAKDLLAGKRGVCGHVDVSQAWHQTDHSDPGPAFPWDEFMAVVRDEEDDLTPEQMDQLAQAVAVKILGYENPKVNGDRDVYQVISDGSLVRDTIQAPGRPKTGNVNWTAQSYLFETFAAVARTYNLLSSVAGKVGADVDEAALAQQLAAALGPVLQSLVADAAAAGGSPEQIAQAVVDKLGAALTTEKES